MAIIDNLGSLFSILSFILFWGVVLIVAIRSISVALGRYHSHVGAVGLRKFALRLITENTNTQVAVGESRTLHTNLKIIIFGLCIRLATLVLAYIVIGRSGGWDISISQVFHSFNRWDAGHYLGIAEQGYNFRYDHYGRNLFVVFFPLYPYLVRAVAAVVRSYFVAAYVVSFASYLGALVFLFHLVKIDFSHRTAWWAVILISIFPGSHFFGAPYTESLFILTTIATLYYIRKHEWLMAGMWGALATATRMVSVVLIAAMEFAMTHNIFAEIKKGNWKRFFKLLGQVALISLLMLVGTGIYLLINWHYTGDALRFLYFQETHWNNGFLYFGSALRMQFDIMQHIDISWYNIANNSTLYIHGLNILAIGFVIWMLVYGCHRRNNAAFLTYSLGYTFVSFSMVWLISGGRYAAALVPVFISLAEFTARKKYRWVVVPLVLVPLFIIVTRMYVLGGWVL